MIACLGFHGAQLSPQPTMAWLWFMISKETTRERWSIINQMTLELLAVLIESQDLGVFYVHNITLNDSASTHIL